MSHNHSLIINIHWYWQRLCSLCFITVLQTFCEGPNNGGPSLAKFHEGPDPRTLAGSTPITQGRKFWRIWRSMVNYSYVCRKSRQERDGENKGTKGKEREAGKMPPLQWIPGFAYGVSRTHRTSHVSSVKSACCMIKTVNSSRQERRGAIRGSKRFNWRQEGSQMGKTK